MSLLDRPAVASLVGRGMQRAVLAARPKQAGRFPECPGDKFELTVPNSVAPARAVVYRPPESAGVKPPVYVNLHGGGFVMPLTDMDDPVCRFLAARAGVVVINVDYALAPQHRFPEPPHQAFEIVQWIAEHGDEHGWDATRLAVGGQSAGGSLAAAVARQAWERGGPPLELQVLHYPALDLVTRSEDKPSPLAKPMLRPWMGRVFNGSYVPDPGRRIDRLASPANPADVEDLSGIAPAVMITAEHDLLRSEGQRYAQRLGEVGALVEHHDLSGLDHGYDVKDADRAREGYDLIAGHLRRALVPERPDGG